MKLKSSQNDFLGQSSVNDINQWLKNGESHYPGLYHLLSEIASLSLQVRDISIKTFCSRFIVYSHHRWVAAFLSIKLINNASSCIITLSKSLNVPSMPLVRLLIMVINIRSLTLTYSSAKRCLLNHLVFWFDSKFYRRCKVTLT